LKTSAAAIPQTDRLIVTYSASLDLNTAPGLTLTNVAGATQWLSADPAVTAPGNVHTYTGALTNGTPGVLDNQDAWSLTTESPVLTFTKTVYDVTTGQSGANARPGDTLKYTLTIQNVSPVGATNFSLTDELDKLNTPAMFVPGSLTLVTVPAGANTTLTSATGGAKGTGLVSISNLSIDPQGGANDKLVIEFQATLVPVITSGSVVLNQAQIGSAILATQLSDDPSIGGTTDPTRTLIASAPAWRVQKTAQDRTGDPAVLLAGDTLRYTITVKNIGTENAINVTLRDQLPANTTYVANSTTLNGAAVADPSASVSALQNGFLIHSPGDATAGAMPADATGTATNVATVTFDVVINNGVVSGTIISNQGFVTGSGTGSGTFPQKPSDDPATSTPDDPTLKIVGNLPLVITHKTVQILADNGSPGIVDPGDVLRYTITLSNTGAVPATGVVLTDGVPANTTYVANSVQLNGLGVGQPDGGVSPLIAGIPVSSSNLTPPLPAPGAGTLSPGGTATVTFDVQVNGGVAAGTVISNQGTVTTNELPSQLTDADGVPSNGYQPTVIVVGSGQLLTITKEVFVVGGGTVQAGGQLEYVVRATNVGSVPATNVVITDDLSAFGANPYVAGSGTLNGLTNGISYAAPVLTANYSSVYGALAAGASAELRFRVNVPSGLPIGTTLTNTGQVTWNSPSQTASASVSVATGGVPGSASLTGSVWHDANFNNVYDSGELNLAGWTVRLLRNGSLFGTTTTDANGAYHLSGLPPNDTTTDQYEIRFLAPGAGPNTALLGMADSAFTNGLQRISGIVAGSGSIVQNLNLPIDPDGVVYNSLTRTPVAGVALAMVQASTRTPLPTSCFDDPAQQNQVTLASGYYKFDLNFSDPSCPSGGDYLIQVTVPGTNYVAAPSQVIPPTTSDTTATFTVATCPGGPDDAIPSTNYCEAQPSEIAPGLSVPAGSTGTKYYLHVTLSNGQIPQYSQLFNNHIPIDPQLNGAVAITKTTSLVNVTRGQMVPYTIMVRNTMSVTLTDLAIVDTLPPGFKYVEGSGRYDGNPVEPVRNGREVRWENVQLIPNQQHTIKLLAVVGAGVSEGQYVNQAQMATGLTGGYASGVATATVRVVPDPTFDCTDIIGKVFDDANLNGIQDGNEKGLGGVRVVSARGLIMKTDEYGRFHVSCAAVPNELRGSNFILKLDERSLPSGYRLTTNNPLVQRLTRGKAIKFNFGATIHRVVSLDIADGVFEPGTTTMRPQWVPRLDLLIEELRKGPAVLRLSYLADVEDAGLVTARLKAVQHEMSQRWAKLNCCYRLNIESETFWRRGAPAERKSVSK